MTPDQVLDGGADLIDKRGIYRPAPGEFPGEGSGRGIGGQLCAAEGMREVSQREGDALPSIEYYEAFDALKSAILSPTCMANGVFIWSDLNSKDEVTSTMRAVAATLRMRQARLLPVVVKTDAVAA